MVERVSPLVSLCYRLFPSDLYRLSCHKSVKPWSWSAGSQDSPELTNDKSAKQLVGCMPGTGQGSCLGFPTAPRDVEFLSPRRRAGKGCNQSHRDVFSFPCLVNISFVNFLFTVRTSIQYWKHFSQIFSLTFDNSSIFLPRFQFLERLSQVTFAQNLGPAVGNVSSPVRMEAGLTNMECSKITLTELATSF